MNDANSRQVGGSHYRGDGKRLQHWDLMIELDEGYFPSVITKYTERWEDKNGLQDVEKSIHYAEKWFQSNQYIVDRQRRWPKLDWSIVDGASLSVGASSVPGLAVEEKRPRLDAILEYCRSAKLDELQTRIFVAVLSVDEVSPSTVLNLLSDLRERAAAKHPPETLEPVGRLVPRGLPDVQHTPGTPEDGGHHAEPSDRRGTLLF